VQIGRKMDPSYKRVLFLCWGTRGDAQPALALAIKLKKMGKDVTMFVTPPSDDMVRKEGITCVAASESMVWTMDALATCDPADTSCFGMMKQLKAVKAFRATEKYKAAIEADTRAGYELAVAFKPDVILHAGFEYGIWASLGEALGVPVVRYDLQPVYPTSEIGFFKKPNGSLPSCFNWLSYLMYNKFAIAKAQRPRAMELRQIAGLSLTAHSDGSKLQLPPNLPQMCAMSPFFIPQPSDWPAFKEMTGYWFMPAGNYTPPGELTAFLKSGPPPLFIGFGSMKGYDEFCKQLSTMAITALANSKQRGILLGGWAGLTAKVLDTSTTDGKALADYAAANIFELPGCPFDWLFQQCAAVVHHGGAGTVAAGLVAGKPTIVCSIFSDQPWHGSLIEQKKLGLYAGPVGKLKGATLGAMITRMLADDEIKANCEAIGASLSTEDGTGNAAKFIDRSFSGWKYPWQIKSKTA
jgi:sterol 3beta-glucosyltransferase